MQDKNEYHQMPTYRKNPEGVAKSTPEQYHQSLDFTLQQRRLLPPASALSGGSFSTITE
jgi:hypothetical protein